MGMQTPKIGPSFPMPRGFPSGDRPFPVRLWEHDEFVIGEALALLRPWMSFKEALLPDPVDGTLIVDGKPVSLDGAVYTLDDRVVLSENAAYAPGDRYRFDIAGDNLRFVPMLPDGGILPYTPVGRPARFGGTVSTDQEGWMYDVSRRNGLFVVRLMNDEENTVMTFGALPRTREYSFPDRAMHWQEVYGRALVIQRLATARPATLTPQD